MEIIFRIPTKDSYAYIEVHAESIETCPPADKLKEKYEEYYSVMNNGTKREEPATDKQKGAIRYALTNLNPKVNAILVAKHWKVEDLTKEQASMVLDEANKE